MKRLPLALLGLFGLTGTFLSPAMAATPAAPNGDQILRQMCAQLAAAHQYTFTAHREIDPALLPGAEVAQVADVQVTVSRPDKIAARAKSKLGVRRAYADGQNFT